MKKKVLDVAVMSMALMLASCGSNKKMQNADQVKGVGDGVAIKTDHIIDEGYLIPTNEERKVIDGNNEFAVNLFRHVSDFDSKVVSPMSVVYLMGMLANGADGLTRQEIMNAIGCKDVSVEQLNKFYEQMIKYAGNFDKATTINIANYIALNKHFNLKKGFVEVMRDSYQAGIESLDFSSAACANKINKWCSDHTNGMIPKIIDQVESLAVSYIMNAVYFNGAWSDKFDKKLTKLENFQGYTRDIKKVDMMHRNAKYMYTDNDMFAALQIPYGNGAYKMTVLLPNRDKSINEMMRTLDGKALRELRYRMYDCIVDLKLPRFTSEIDLPLNDIISKLGAPSMFGGSANFSRFADGGFMVSKMLQKAKIEVSEEGTKAAAVTAAVMTMSAFHPEEPRRVEFHANRPFVYMITESSTGVILFMGQFTGSEI